MTNTVLLKQTIEDKGIKYKFLAQKLGISSQWFYSKLKGDAEFKVSEIATLREILSLNNQQINDIFFGF